MNGLSGFGNAFFTHSKEFDQGLGTRQVRVGQSTVVVAQDGSGDFEDIQEAVNELPSDGGEIFIKEGTYNIDSSIVINKDNVKITGTGKSSKIKTSSAIDMITADSKNYLHIESIYLEGKNGAVYDDNAGIKFDNCVECKIINCWFSECERAIEMWGSLKFDAFNIISNCFANNSVLEGVLVGYNNKTIISNNQVNNAGSSNGIRITEGNQYIIIGNLASGNSSDGINVDSNRSVINGNTCINNDYGINIVSGATRNTATNNILLDNNTNLRDGGTTTQLGHNITS